MTLLRRLWMTWGLWRLQGYDGKPTTLGHAYEIASALFPPEGP